MRPCKAWSIQIPLHVSGDLDKESAARVESHLSQCPACREYYLQMQKLVNILQPEPLSIDPTYASEMVVALNEKLHAKPARSRGWRYLLALGSAAVIIFSITLLPNWLRHKGSSSFTEGIEDLYVNLTNIGYFSEMPENSNGQENDNNFFAESDLYTTAAADFVYRSNYLPVDHFIQVTTPMQDSEFDMVVEQIKTAGF